MKMTEEKYIECVMWINKEALKIQSTQWSASSGDPFPSFSTCMAVAFDRLFDSRPNEKKSFLLFAASIANPGGKS